ncbi:MAG: FAD synthetase family protein, partial [Stomatobaculum sp.]|nr:FAD synthetase family protein [Stomatobaculum sp.]
MNEWIGTTDVRIEEPTVVAIGKFDGEHMGHRKILERMKKIAEEEGIATAVFTFGTPPSAVVGGAPKEQINTNAERREKLREAGIDYIVEYPFTPEIASMSGEAFVRDILIRKMNMKAIVAGPDCAFGKNRSGNADLLRRMGPECGFLTEIIEKEKFGGR